MTVTQNTIILNNMWTLSHISGEVTKPLYELEFNLDANGVFVPNYISKSH